MVKISNSPKQPLPVSMKPHLVPGLSPIKMFSGTNISLGVNPSTSVKSTSVIPNKVKNTDAQIIGNLQNLGTGIVSVGKDFVDNLWAKNPNIQGGKMPGYFGKDILFAGYNPAIEGPLGAIPRLFGIIPQNAMIPADFTSQVDSDTGQKTYRSSDGTMFKMGAFGVTDVYNPNNGIWSGTGKNSTNTGTGSGDISVTHNPNIHVPYENYEYSPDFSQSITYHAGGYSPTWYMPGAIQSGGSQQGYTNYDNIVASMATAEGMYYDPETGEIIYE